MNNPEVDNRSSTKPVSEFTINKEPSFHRVKSGDAAHEISQVMQAAAKSQREGSSNITKHSVQV